MGPWHHVQKIDNTVHICYCFQNNVLFFAFVGIFVRQHINLVCNLEMVYYVALLLFFLVGIFRGYGFQFCHGEQTASLPHAASSSSHMFLFFGFLRLVVFSMVF